MLSRNVGKQLQTCAV